MTSRRSSTSSRAERAVEPTRSQNKTVRCRRSAREVSSGARGGAAAGEAPNSSFSPHCEQNFDPGALTFPQAPQGTCKGAPHWLQNLLPLATSAAQLGHAIPLTVDPPFPVSAG